MHGGGGLPSLRCTKSDAGLLPYGSAAGGTRLPPRGRGIDRIAPIAAIQTIVAAALKRTLRERLVLLPWGIAVLRRLSVTQR